MEIGNNLLYAIVFIALFMFLGVVHYNDKKEIKIREKIKIENHDTIITIDTLKV